MELNGRDVVLKALVGSHNYNLATETSDKDYKVFVAPTFEDLYSGKMYAHQTIGETEDNDIHDIRKLSHLLFKANLNFLEVLASNEIIIPNDEPEIHKIFSMKKEIFKMNLPYLFNACKGMHMNKMSLLLKGTEGTQHLVDKFGYDTKQAQHAYRCMKVIVDFEATNFEDFDGAIRYSGTDETFMRELKAGVFKLDVFQNFVKHYYESTFIHLGSKYAIQPVNLELKDEIDKLIMSLIKRKIVS